MTLVIKEGPSKLDLMLGLFHNDQGGYQHYVSFTLLDANKKKFQRTATFSSCKRADKSGENWIIEGLLGKNHLDPESCIKPFSGTYSCRTRTGELTTSDDPNDLEKQLEVLSGAGG